MGDVRGGSELGKPKIVSVEKAKLDFIKYVTGYYSAKSHSNIIDYHPALQMVYKMETAEYLWKHFGISWAELNKMDPSDIDKITQIYQVRLEIRGPQNSGCPLA